MRHALIANALNLIRQRRSMMGIRCNSARSLAHLRRSRRSHLVLPPGININEINRSSSATKRNYSDCLKGSAGKLAESSDKNERGWPLCPKIHPNFSWVKVRTDFHGLTFCRMADEIDPLLGVT